MRTITPQSNYFNIINRIKSQPYLYISMYNDARKKLTNEEFRLLQKKLAMGN